MYFLIHLRVFSTIVRFQCSIDPQFCCNYLLFQVFFCLFFSVKKRNSARKKWWKLSREKKVPLKLSKKPSKSTREKIILPLKFFIKFLPVKPNFLTIEKIKIVCSCHRKSVLKNHNTLTLK